MSRLQQIQRPALITRLAPTPSGYLHLGNVFSFLLTWLIARKNGGQILLRIDDLDAQRVRPQYVDNIFRTLEWMGLDWDLGPFSVEALEQSFSQRHRMGLYEEALQRLRNMDEVFACECSRKILKDVPAGKVRSCNCEQKSPGLAHSGVAWRLQTAGITSLLLKNIGGHDKEVPVPPSEACFVVRRKDGMPAYHLTSLVDDEHFGINTVVRGEDLYNSTLAQLALAQKLGATRFSKARFLHHPLLLHQGSKLSKSQKSPSAIEAFHHNKGNLLRKLGSLMGLREEQSGSLHEMLKHTVPLFDGLSKN